jgi:hypothetical protein
LFQDVNLGATDLQEIDLANGAVNNGRVDGFLTAPDCAKLFDQPYEGTASQALCKIYIGPVAPGGVSQRLSVPHGRYRMFVQAWASNELPNIFSVDLGLYSSKCQPNLAAPGP